jgi:hypothetical protein
MQQVQHMYQIALNKAKTASSHGSKYRQTLPRLGTLETAGQPAMESLGKRTPAPPVAVCLLGPLPLASNPNSATRVVRCHRPDGWSTLGPSPCQAWAASARCACCGRPAG